MLTKALFREYDYPNNTISCSQGDNVVFGNGTKFTEIPLGVMIEAEGYGFIGKILSVEDDSTLTLDRPCFTDIADAVFWQDWSIWRIGNNAVNKKVESDNPGEAGAVVFDNVTMTFYMGNKIKVGGTDYLNPGAAAFSGDIDSKKRFIIKIMGVNYDYPEDTQRLITSTYDHLADDAGKYLTVSFKDLQSRTVFEGIIDFTTISLPTRIDASGEMFDSISHDIVDKLSALNTLATIATRTKGFMNPDVTGAGDIDQVRYYKWWDRNDFGIYYSHGEGGGSYQMRTIDNTNAPDLGDILDINFLQMSESAGLALIIFKWLDTAQDSGAGRMYYDVFTNYTGWNAGTTDPDKLGSCDSIIESASVQKWIDSLFNGEDIFIYESVTKEIKTPSGIRSITGQQISAIDGIKLINAILKQKWPDAQMVNKLKEILAGAQLTSFPLPLNFIFQLLDEFPFGKEPLDALAYITNSLDSWIFTNLAGAFVLQNNNSFAFPETEPALTVIDLDQYRDQIKTANKKFFWDKLIDSVVVNVTSWIPDPDDSTGFLTGIGYAFKVEGIKPRNEMQKDVIVDQATLTRYGFVIQTNGTITFPGGTFGGITYPALTDQSDVLNQYGDFVAIEKMNFYGKRHESYDIEMIKVTWDMLAWELLFLFNYNGKKYFMTNLSFDLDGNSASFTLVSVDGYDYNLDNVIIGKVYDDYLAGN